MTFKSIALIGLTTLTFGSVVGTVSSADAQAMRPYGYLQNYDGGDQGLVGDLTGATIGTGAAIAGAAFNGSAFVASVPSNPNYEGNFGYRNWPYGNGYYGGGVFRAR